VHRYIYVKPLRLELCRARAVIFGSVLEDKESVMPRLNNTDAKTVEEFGFEFSAPPEIPIVRKSKHEELWENAKALCDKFPGQSLRVLTYTNKGTAYQTAKAINNGDNKAFKEDYLLYTARASQVSVDDKDTFGIWLTRKTDEEIAESES
jgi:hypothetical protein